MTEVHTVDNLRIQAVIKAYIVYIHQSNVDYVRKVEVTLNFFLATETLWSLISEIKFSA